MRRVLITGGAGFIGSHLAERFLADGCQVTVVDDLSTGRRENLARLLGDSAFSLVVDSVLNAQRMEELVRHHDRILHLASAVGVKLILDQPVRTIETIFGGTEVVLRAAAKHRKRILITSTSEVYGKGVSVPFHEDDDVLTGATCRHRWAYAAAKALDEFLALAHWRESQLPVVVTRLFNTVGPRQTGQYGMVLPQFVGAALAGKPLLVHGDGKQSRCFAHVEDIVGALAGALECEACFGQVVNLGNDQEISIQDLAETIVRELGSTSPILRIPYSAVYGEGFEDMRRRVPCLDKASRLLGYRPERDLTTIIQDVAESLGARRRELVPHSQEIC
jgi:UDP-glucose 4-epimerase